MPIATTSPTEKCHDGDDSNNNKKTECAVAPTRFHYKGSEFEYSAYSPASRFLKLLEPVFPHLTARQRSELLVVPVIQRCENDTAGISPEINKEREEKLELVRLY